MGGVISSWWADRTDREQRLFVAAGALAALLAAWQLVLAPLTQLRADARAGLSAAERTLAAVEAGAREIGAARAASDGGARDQAPLSTVVVRSARTVGLALTRTEPQQDGGLSVWVEDVRAPVFYAWLAEMERSAGVGVRRAAVQRDGPDGRLRANVVLAGRGDAA